MTQSSDGLDLRPEARQLCGVHLGCGQDHLESDRALQGNAPRPVDHSHAAAPEYALDLVAGDGRVGCRNRNGARLRSAAGLRNVSKGWLTAAPGTRLSRAAGSIVSLIGGSD